MNSEEHLDDLIERRAYQMDPFSKTNDEFAAELAAASVLTSLQKIEAPPEFARQLELHLRARARNLARQHGRPASLPVTRPHASVQARRSSARRLWISVLGIAAALLLAFVGLLNASAHSLPGDTLYGIKQTMNQFTLDFTSNPQNLASTQIDQLRSALDDLNSVVAAGRDENAIHLALSTVATKTSASQQAVAALPAGSQRESGQRELAGALAREDQVLRALLNHVNWRLRLAFTRQLGEFGEAVPTITQASVHLQSNGTFLITLTGTSFAPQAALVIDGQPTGKVINVTLQQLSAVISKTAFSPGEHTIGILNPDGTAVQTVINDDDGDKRQDQQGTQPVGDDQNHSGRFTPTPGSHDNDPNDD